MKDKLVNAEELAELRRKGGDYGAAILALIRERLEEKRRG